MTATFKNELISHIRQRSHEITDHTNQAILTIEESVAVEIAEQFDVSLRNIYMDAMSLKIWPLRYVRNRNSFSLKEQLSLAESEVAVIGSGGLGGHVSLLLARLGIGKLVIIDHDVFDETNLNRQAICTTENIGDPKPDQTFKQITVTNPAVEVISRYMKFKPDEAGTLLRGSTIIVDALDNAKDRLLLGGLAGQLGIPLVHGAVSGFEGRVMTVFPGDMGMSLLYNPDDDTSNTSSEKAQGTPAVAPCVIGALQVMEVVKVLLERGRPYSNTIMHADLENGVFQSFKL